MKKRISLFSLALCLALVFSARASAETPAPAGIEVRELCSVAGYYLEDGGYSGVYSYRLPELVGADTPWLREINAAVRDIYENDVLGALDSMERYHYLPRRCISYYCGEKDGVRSLLITADSDWGEDSFWCFNYSDAGEKLDSAAVLEAVGMSAEDFVSAVRDYYTEATDYSAYFPDESWRELQEQTLAENNCSAALPMVILPNGNLCFIGTLYTPAGAGRYDQALEFTEGRKIERAELGSILLTRLSGTWLVEDDAEEACMLEFVPVGESLTLEYTFFNREYGSVYSYAAEELIPEDPAALLRADLSSLPVRLLSYCPDVFGGQYTGEACLCTLSLERDRLSFTFSGGGETPLGESRDFTARRCYPEALGLDDPVPGTDRERFDYDAAQAAGVTGLWHGYAEDEGLRKRSLTLELTSWGGMSLRSTAETGLPVVLQGSYYIAREGDDFAPAGALVYHLVRRGGYKMPLFGWCRFEAEGGTLRLSAGDPAEALPGGGQTAELRLAARDRRLQASQVLRLNEGESVSAALSADGSARELRFSFMRDEAAGGAITALRVLLDGTACAYQLDYPSYEAELWLLVPPLSGSAYLYLDELSDNDRHFTEILAVEPGGLRYAGSCFGGFAGEPSDTGSLLFAKVSQLLSTAAVVRSFRLGETGLPEAIEPCYRFSGGPVLTSLRALDCWAVDPASGALTEPAALPAGCAVRLYRTDGSNAVDLLLENGEVRRLWLDADSWPQTVGGQDIEDCFSGLRFAG